MADNTTLPGTGDVIADEDISGVKYQLVKLINPTAASTARWVGVQTKANSLPTTRPSDDFLEVTGSLAATGNVIAATDVSLYGVVSLQLTGTFNATTQFEGSNDNSTWASVQLQQLVAGASASTAASSTGTPNTIWYGFVPTRYFRARISTYTSGTVVATAEFRPMASTPLPLYQYSSLSGNGSFGGQAIHSANYVLGNGSSYENLRGVIATTLLSSSARTATTNSTDQSNTNWRGFLLTVDVSSAGTGSITPSIQVKDSISSNYKTIWTAATPLTANGTYVYALSPGAASAASYTEIAQLLIGRTWRLAMVANNANSVTYSASADMLV